MREQRASVCRPGVIFGSVYAGSGRNVRVGVRDTVQFKGVPHVWSLPHQFVDIIGLPAATLYRDPNAVYMYSNVSYLEKC